MQRNDGPKVEVNWRPSDTALVVPAGKLVRGLLSLSGARSSIQSFICEGCEAVVPGQAAVSSDP